MTVGGNPKNMHLARQIPKSGQKFDPNFDFMLKSSFGNWITHSKHKKAFMLHNDAIS